MNNEVESYVGELRELREKNKSLSERVKSLEEEIAWRTKYGEYMNHQYIMQTNFNQEKKYQKDKIKIEEDSNSGTYRAKYFSGSLNY
tara:strand:- start:563 stop:823 length:261 start_codon:yes stop_codon:yes gene_type:complete